MELIEALPDAGEFAAVAAQELHEALLGFESSLSEKKPAAEDLDPLYEANELLFGLPPELSPESYSARARYGFLREVLVQSEEAGASRLPRVSVVCVFLNQLEGRHDEVRRIVAEGLRIIERPGDRFELRVRAAQSAIVSGDYREAEEQMATLQVELDGRYTPSQEAIFLTVKTELDLGLGLLDQAIRDVVRQIEVASSLSSAHRLRAQQQYCETLLAVGQARRAVESVEALLEGHANIDALARSQLLSVRAAGHYLLAVHGEGEPALARKSLVEVVEHPGMPAEDLELAWLSLAELDSAEGDLVAAGERLARLGGGPQSPEFEARRAAIAHRICPSKEAWTDLARAWDRMLASWRQVEVRSGGVGFLEFGPRRLVASELVRASLQNFPGEAGRRKALAHVIEGQELGHFARSSGYRSRPLEQVLSRLSSESSGLLVFLSGLRSTHVFAADIHGVAHAEVASVRELRTLGGPWWNQVRFRPRGDVESARSAIAALGEPLAQALLPGRIRERLSRWDAPTIVGASFLGHLPIEPLPFGPPSEGGVLGDRKALAHLPSVPLGVLLKERAGRETDIDLVLLLAPAFSAEALESIEPIPLHERHAERLTRGFDDKRMVLWTGKAATREVLKRSELARAKLLHLFSHGVTLDDRSRTAGLALAPSPGDSNGYLDCQFVEENVVAPPVVLLSACRAGAGRTRMGDDGPAHLGGAFLSAGARAVVLSPVELELEAQSRFVEHFQARLLAGDPVGEAARAARAALARDEATAHPYYARVLVLGDGDLRLYD